MNNPPRPKKKKKPIGQARADKQRDAPGESVHRLEPEDKDEPLDHAGATEESKGADDDGKMVKGRPALKEIAQLVDDEQGNAKDSNDQAEGYHPRDEITPG